MLKKLFPLLLLISCFTNAQQGSKIKHVKTNGGVIDVTQTGNDSAQKSTIDSITGDTFKISVNQNQGGKGKVKEEKKDYMYYVEKFAIVLGIPVSFIAIMTYISSRRRRN